MNPFDAFGEDELNQAKLIGSLACELKKKRDEGLVSMFSSSMNRYFRFFGYGRFLVYFDEKPTHTTQPKNIVVIDEVESVERNFTGKKGHFNIKLKGGKNVHLKHDEEAVSNNWADTILKLKDFYKDHPFASAEANRKWKDKLDPRIVQIVCEELESIF